MDDELLYDAALKEIRGEVSPVLRKLGFRKSSAYIWKLVRPNISFRVRLDVSWRDMGVLQVDIEAAPTVEGGFVEHFWLLLPRLAGRDDAYRIGSEVDRRALIADLPHYVSDFVLSWESFDELWLALLRGDVRDDPSFDLGRDAAAKSALEIAVFRDLGERKVAEAVSYIKSQGWRYRLLPDRIAEKFPELLSF